MSAVSRVAVINRNYTAVLIQIVAVINGFCRYRTDCIALHYRAKKLPRSALPQEKHNRIPHTKKDHVNYRKQQYFPLVPRWAPGANGGEVNEDTGVNFCSYLGEDRFCFLKRWRPEGGGACCCLPCLLIKDVTLLGVGPDVVVVVIGLDIISLYILWSCCACFFHAKFVLVYILGG